MKSTYYSNQKGTVMTVMSGDEITYVVLERFLVPSSSTSNGTEHQHQQVEVVSLDATLLPSTHQIPNTVTLDRGMLSFHDIGMVLRIVEGGFPDKDGTYQWYYSDTLQPHTNSSSDAILHLPEHMKNLFANTNLTNLASSPNIQVVVFAQVPKVQPGTPEEILVMFAVAHLAFSNRTLLGGIDVEHQRKRDLPLVTLEQITTNGLLDLHNGKILMPSKFKLFMYVNTNIQKMINAQNYILDDIWETRNKELVWIQNELSLASKTLLKNPSVSISLLSEYKRKLKKLNKLLVNRGMDK
jgi:hypothetical protein